MLDDLDTLARAAAASDGVIHLAFKHDIAFTGDFQGAADADRRAVETFGDALAGTGRPLVIASGLLGLAPGRVATEADGHAADPALAAAGTGPQTRLGTAEVVVAMATRNVRSSVVRLPPTVHGDGDTGFVAVPGRDGPGARRVGLHRRRRQPLARRPPLRCGPPVPTGPGAGTSRIDTCTPSPTRVWRSATSPA